MRQWKPRLVQAGIHELVFEDAQDLLIDQFNSLGTPDSITVAALESNMRDDSISPMVRWLSYQPTSELTSVCQAWTAASSLLVCLSQ